MFYVTVMVSVYDLVKTGLLSENSLLTGKLCTKNLICVLEDCWTQTTLTTRKADLL